MRQIEQKAIESYSRLKNLKLVGEEIGIPWQNVYIHLRNNNVNVTGDKSRYGSDKDRLAAKAEKLFKAIVPFADDQNETKYQSKFDFMVKGNKVDVKASTLKQSSKRFPAKRWMFSVKKQELIADYLACFAFIDDDNYRFLLIPGEFIRHYQTISISCAGNSKWDQFAIDPKDVSQFFTDLNAS